MTDEELRALCEEILRDDNAPYAGPDETESRLRFAACRAPALARALLSRLTQPQAEWPLIESAPKDGTEICVFQSDVVFAARWIEWRGAGPADGWYKPGSTLFAWVHFACPTRWQPLPPAPVKEGG